MDCATVLSEGGIRQDVFTFFGTIIYYDSATDRVKHGRAAEVPSNLGLLRDSETAVFVLDHPTGGRRLTCDDSGALYLGQMAEPDARSCGPLAISHTEWGAIGIRRNELYLSAQPDGTVHFSRNWCQEWEQFRTAPSSSAAGARHGRQVFHVALDRGNGMARMAAVRKEHVLPPFYIWAPPYSPYSGGILVLHLLCHFLNHLGVEAFVKSGGVSGRLHTPQLTPELARAHAAAGRLPVCIYPEIVLANEMSGTRVVRLLLNQPGQRGKVRGGGVAEFWASPQRRMEYLVDFAREFKDADLPSRTLFVPIVDDRNFYDPPAGTERRGFLVYSHRVRVTPEMIPAWAQPHTMIDMQNHRTPEVLGELYRRSEGLIVFERTGAQLEAAMCGCPVVAVPGFGLPDIPMRALFGSDGVGWGANVAELDRARRTLPQFQENYLRVAAGFLDELADCVGSMMTFFSGQRA